MTDAPAPPSRRVPWLPVVVFLVAAFAFAPLALLGQRAYAPVDVTAQASPYRDQANQPSIVNPVQNDVPEAQAVQASFWNDVRDGHFQLWSHATGAGVPTGALPFSALTAPLAIGYLFTPRWYAPGLRSFLQLLAAEWGVYLLARRMKLGVAAATVAGVAFAFSGAQLVMMQRVGAAAVAPWVIWCCLRLVDVPTTRRTAAFAAVVAWSWLEGFAAATLFTIYVAAAWTLWTVVVERPRASGSATGRAGGGVRPWLRWLAPRAVALGGGGAVAGLLVAFQVLPFSAVVKDSGLLDTRKFDGTVAIGAYGLFGQIDNAVIGGLKGPWVSVANSFEGIGFTGSIALVGALAALVLLALGRLRVPAPAARTVPFLGLGVAVATTLTYTGGFLLDVAYALPGMRSNTIYRHRWFIPLFCSLLLAVALDHVWRAAVTIRAPDEPGDDVVGIDGPIDADERWGPPRWVRVTGAVALVAVLVVVGRAVPTFLEGLRTFGTRTPVLRAFVRAALVAAVAAVVVLAPLAVRRYGRRAVQVAGAALAASVWCQLAVPMYGWIPQVRTAPYYSSSPLYEDLRRLAGQRWRFLGTGEYGPYLNSAAVEGLLDVRTTPVLDKEYRTLVEASLPTAFAGDKLKTVVQRADLDMGAAALDELSVRYVVVGTAETPLGDVGEAPPPVSWVPAAQAASLRPVLAAGGVAGVGVALRVTDRCAGFVRVALTADGRELGSSRRPAWDLAGAPDENGDATFAVTGGDDVAPDTAVGVAVTVEDGSCPVEVGVDADGRVAARLFSLPFDGAWRVVSTRDGWVYERPGAKPLVRIDAGEVTAWSLVPNGVRASVTATRVATVTVAENDDRGWTVRVDGKPVTPVSVDGALVGVPVPAGAHEIALDYTPPGFRAGVALSALGLASLAGLVVWPAWAGRRRARYQ